MIRARATLLAPLAVAALAAGCGDDDASGSNGPRTVEVALTDAGCEPAKFTVKAGPTTFRVTNRGATEVDEFEVLEGDQVLGEAEGLGDGDEGSFALTLKKGSYDVACPGGDSASRGTLTVTGSGAAPAELSPEQEAAVERYRAYLEQNTASLVERTGEFAGAVKSGDIERAKGLFATTREPYEAIEPVAESFGDLDPAIDSRINDVDGGFSDWTGFHRLEWALWKQGRIGAREKEVADGLVADVEALASKVKTVELEPAQIVNGSNTLLGEVAKSKITGEEDRYSHTDLWDFDANLAGSRRAFESAKPLLAAEDPELSRTIEARFAAAQGVLDRHRRGDGWVLYTELSEAETRALSQAIDALAEPLSEAPGKLVSG